MSPVVGNHHGVAILPGDLVRTSRAQAFHRTLGETLGIEDEWESPLSTKPPPHESPVVQVATSTMFSHGDVVGLFIYEYLAAKLPAGIDLPMNAKNVGESLEFRRKKRRRRRRVVKEGASDG